MAETITDAQKPSFRERITVFRESITEHYDALHLPYGTMIINSHDPLIETNLQENVREIEELMQFARGAVLDVGANVGSHSINFAKVADVVYAFEPQPRTYYNLCANLLLNLVFNVIPFNMALGSYDGETRVANLDPTKPNTPMGVQVGNGQQPVRMATIDSLNISPVHFIKIDVEGHELEVLKGAYLTLKYENPILYVEIHDKALIQPIVELMAKHGYLSQEYITVCMPDKETGEPIWLTTGYLFYREGRIVWVE